MRTKIRGFCKPLVRVGEIIFLLQGVAVEKETAKVVIPIEIWRVIRFYLGTSMGKKSSSSNTFNRKLKLTPRDDVRGVESFELGVKTMEKFELGIGKKFLTKTKVWRII